MKRLLNLIKSKVRVRLFAVVLLILIFLLALINLGSYPILMRMFTGRTYRTLCNVADMIDSFIPDNGNYYIDLFTLAENNNVDIEIIDPGGYLTYTTTGGGSALSSDRFSPTASSSRYFKMQDTDSSGTYNYRNFEKKIKLATDADYFVYHDELNSGDTVYIFSPVADVEKVVETADSMYSVFSGIAIIIMAVAFFVTASRFIKPVVEINDVTKDMANLNFERKCNDYGSDEIGELGRSINTLSNTLDATLLDLKDKNEQLERDIELRLALDNARKSFISNVSHELKTPIAIISGYAEGLREGISDDPETIREYCGIINEECRKMNNLVLELLELSKLESRTEPFKPEYFNIGAAVASLLDHLSLQMSGITVTNNIPAQLNCYAQQDKIEIVLKNYITNAISHCAGIKEIILDYVDLGNRYRFTVYNSGDGIAPDDIGEIWESFYRADKAHGRSENRFGLGLSIVKNIMINHGCEYGVRNAPGGVEFSFETAKNSGYYEKKD